MFSATDFLKTQTTNNMISFADTDLKFGVEVAETDSQHVQIAENLCLKSSTYLFRVSVFCFSHKQLTKE